MALSSAKQPVDMQELVHTTAVKRGVELAQSVIVRILGRKPFTRIRLGRTDLDLKQTTVIRKNWSASPLFTSKNVRTAEEVERTLAAWLKACHGARWDEGGGDDMPLKPGTTTVYIAVQ